MNGEASFFGPRFVGRSESKGESSSRRHSHVPRPWARWARPSSFKSLSLFFFLFLRAFHYSEGPSLPSFGGKLEELPVQTRCLPDPLVRPTPHSFPSHISSFFLSVAAHDTCATPMMLHMIPACQGDLSCTEWREENFLCPS